jgi:threonine/homoserine/homoserine lactone efflux protein
MAQPYIAAAVPWGAAGALVASALAIMGSPGPTTLSLVAAGSAYGARVCLPYLAGLVLGTLVVLAAVAAGITAALLAVPALSTALLLVSAAYILWLAYHIATAPPLGAPSAGAAAPSLAAGALLGVANPKAWVAIAAVFASATLASAPLADAGAKFALLSAIVVLIHVVWLGVGISLAPLLRDPRRSRAVNLALAAALVAATGLAVTGAHA